MSHTREHYVELLYMALASDFGLSVRVDGDVQRARSKFLEAKKKLLDPALDVLSFRRTNNEGELWLVKLPPGN